MGSVTRLHHALALGPAESKAVAELDRVVAKAIDSAKAAGLPQGLFVSLLNRRA